MRLTGVRAEQAGTAEKPDVLIAAIPGAAVAMRALKVELAIQTRGDTWRVACEHRLLTYANAAVRFRPLAAEPSGASTRAYVTGSARIGNRRDPSASSQADQRVLANPQAGGPRRDRHFPLPSRSNRR